jgi:hypothetical protein
MKTIELPTTPLSDEERLCLAQEVYREYSTRCFWFMREDLIVTKENLPLIIEGLKLHGGHKGWKLAHALCR